MLELDPLVSASWLHSQLENPDCRVLDCRFELTNPDAGRAQWLEAHIPGALYVDLDTELAGPVGPETGRHPLPAVEALAASIGQLGIDDQTSVVVYDASGGAIASRAWWLLRWLGHARVALLDGGFPAWLESGLATEQGPVDVIPRNFRARPRSGLLMSTCELVGAGDDISSLNLVDARDSGRFRGELEPIDPVAGHVPGAVNVPFSDNLLPDGRFRGKDELRRLWEGVLGADRDVSWSVMCGSGVTACHLALAGELAGYTEPRLYVGSWSEWIRDPERPVAKGT